MPIKQLTVVLELDQIELDMLCAHLKSDRDHDDLTEWGKLRTALISDLEEQGACEF